VESSRSIESLRTPLNGIIGIAESLKDRKVTRDPFTDRNLQLIITSGKRLATLINDILDYSKLANDNLDLNAHPVDLYALVENVFVLLEPLTRGKELKLINDIKHLAPYVEADENRLQQILINLIGNGIKYTKAGHVRVDLRIENRRAYIYVDDTGVGIETQKQQEIFEVFNQVHQNDAREYDGTGLGLAITKQLVELHGGKIWVESDYGHGAKFVFTLPAADENAVKLRAVPKVSSTTPHLKSANFQGNLEQSVPISEAPRNAKDQTILIVDDDSINRIVLHGILSLHKYNLIEATGGSEAIQALQDHPNIDLIILDVMMPHMTGYEEDLPILFLTAKTGDEDLKQCFEVGGNDYLTKPVNKNDLLARVANHLRLQAAVRKIKIGM